MALAHNRKLVAFSVIKLTNMMNVSAPDSYTGVGGGTMKGIFKRQ